MEFWGLKQANNLTNHHVQIANAKNNMYEAFEKNGKNVLNQFRRQLQIFNSYLSQFCSYAYHSVASFYSFVYDSLLIAGK